MTGLRQKLVALAALTLGSLFAPIRTLALIPHSAPLAASQSGLHPSSPAAVLTQSDAAVSEMCRNDPVNNFDPLGLSSLDRYLADLVENVGGGANAVSCFFDERDAADQRLRGGIRSFAGSVGEAVGLIGSVQAHRAEAILSFGFGRESRVTMLAGDCGGWFHDRAGAFCVSAGDLAWTFSRDALSAAVEQQAQHAELASLARAVQERGWRTVGAEFAPHYAGFAAGIVDGNWRDPKFQTAVTYLALDVATVLLNWSAGASTREAAAAKSIDPSKVRFSQDSAGWFFKGGKGSVGDLAEGLKSGAVKASDVPAIRLVEKDGQLFTLDNRRLEAFRRAGVDVPYQMATPEEAAAEAWKFTTENGGMSIRLRGEP